MLSNCLQLTRPRLILQVAEIQHNFEPIADVEDERQMNDDLVADVSTDEILAEHDSANITILLLLLCTIMMNNAKSKRESKRKS